MILREQFNYLIHLHSKFLERSWRARSVAQAFNLIAAMNCLLCFDLDTWDLDLPKVGRLVAEQRNQPQNLL